MLTLNCEHRVATFRQQNYYGNALNLRTFAKAS
jgi:hypothetical protein